MTDRSPIDHPDIARVEKGEMSWCGTLRGTLVPSPKGPGSYPLQYCFSRQSIVEIMHQPLPSSLDQLSALVARRPESRRFVEIDIEAEGFMVVAAGIEIKMQVLHAGLGEAAYVSCMLDVEALKQPTTHNVGYAFH